MMRLDLSRLQKVRRNADRSVTCACPICRESGHDSGGNHLRIWVDGKFHCIVGSEDRGHNKALRAYLRGTSIDDNPETEYIDPEPTLDIEKTYPEETLAKLVPDYSYWIERGASESVLRSLECGIAPKEEKSKLSGRSIFPIRGLNGRLVGFSGRLLEDNSFAPKYKHMFKSSKVCWPWNVTGPAIKASKTVVLVEGSSDAVILMSHGVDNVLALFGLNINSKIISTLVANDIKRVIISLNRDDDPTKGQRAADKIADRLSVFFSPESIRIVLPPAPFKDWAEADEATIAAFRQEVVS